MRVNSRVSVCVHVIVSVSVSVGEQMFECACVCVFLSACVQENVRVSRFIIRENLVLFCFLSGFILGAAIIQIFFCSVGVEKCNLRSSTHCDRPKNFGIGIGYSPKTLSEFF